MFYLPDLSILFPAGQKMGRDWKGKSCLSLPFLSSFSFFSCYLSFSGLHATRKKNPERFAIQKRQDIKER